MNSPVVHRYHAACTWKGSTGAGYDRYERSHLCEAEPALGELEMTSDPAFRGDPDRLNPEQLLLMAAASCQLLSFLAVAARSRIDVVAYRDEAEAVMPEREVPMRITNITLRPRITVRPPADEELVLRLAERAHLECYIANSLRCEVPLRPEVLIQER